MKILYSANNYSGANIFLSEFLKKVLNHDVKILAYYKNHEFLHHIDWVTNALISKDKTKQFQIKNIFDTNNCLPVLDTNNALILYNEVSDWQPDLIISDVEPIAACLAKSLNIELWYCSPLLLLTGIEWKTNRLSLLRNRWLSIRSLPKANRYLISSPFCDIVNSPFLIDGFEWIKPYAVKPSAQYKNLPRDVVVTTGESSYLANCIYNNENSFIISNDDEQILNAVLAEYYGVGFNLGNNLKILNSIADRAGFNTNFLSISNWPALEDLINEKNNCT